jgi:hypothetical protein
LIHRLEEIDRKLHDGGARDIHTAIEEIIYSRE